MSVDSIVENLKRTLEADDPEGGGEKKFYGVVTGRVINPVDPLMMGRVQVQLPFIDSLDLSPWARVAVPMAGPFCGAYFIPTIGDEVLVAFEHGDVNVPYIIGSLWNMVAQPPLPSPLAQIRATRTLVGNQIVMTEVPPSLTLQSGPTPPEALPSPPSPVGPYQTLMLSPAGIQIAGSPTITLAVGGSSIIITAAGITLQSGGSSVAVTPAGVVIVGPALSMIGSADVTIVGGMVKIN
jgi:hypothetical protein